MHAQLSGTVLAVRLEAGEEVHGALLAACAAHGVAQGFVVSGIGMLADVSLGWYEVFESPGADGPGRYHEQLFPGRHELLSLAGNISDRDGQPFAHLHATLSDEQYRCFGGHLFSATVGLTVEVALLAVAPPVRMRRVLEPRFGLPGLVIE